MRIFLSCQFLKSKVWRVVPSSLKCNYWVRLAFPAKATASQIQPSGVDSDRFPLDLQEISTLRNFSSGQQTPDAPKSCFALIPIVWNSIGRRYPHLEIRPNSKGETTWAMWNGIFWNLWNTVKVRKIRAKNVVLHRFESF